MPKSPTRGRSIIERPSTAILFLLVIFAIGLAVGAIMGKLHPPGPGPSTAQVLIHPSTDPTVFKIGDRIEIYFADLSAPGSEMTKVFTVDQNGTVPIPKLGDLKADGHTAVQLEEEISNTYRKRGIVPLMRVEIKRAGPGK